MKQAVEEVLYLLDFIECDYQFPICTRLGSFENRLQVVYECKRRLKKALILSGKSPELIQNRKEN